MSRLFTWTKTPDDILKKANRKTVSALIRKLVGGPGGPGVAEVKQTSEFSPRLNVDTSRRTAVGPRPPTEYEMIYNTTAHAA